MKSSASSIEIQNVFSKGGLVTRTATRSVGKGIFDLMKISWKNVWKKEPGSLPYRGRFFICFFRSFLNSNFLTLLVHNEEWKTR